MDNILLFAGTSEGRTLSHLKVMDGDSSVNLLVSIATDYGRDLLPEDGDNFTVYQGRMDREEMVAFIARHHITKIIDATHPYAVVVSDNVREAGKETGIPVYRLTREEEERPSNCISVKDSQGAVAYLAGTEGPVLITTGSKELRTYTEIPNFQERLFPRMLPDPEMMENVLGMGYRKQNLICMQGPFALETNVGMLQQIGAKYLVTKESGKAGGFSEKIQAAEKLGVTVVLIGRPQEENDISFEEAMVLCGISLPQEVASVGVISGTKTLMDSRFPMYVDVKDKPVLVVGGGKIALRRAGILRDFQCLVTVVAKEIMEGDWSNMEILEKPFEASDLEGFQMVVAATDDHGLNAHIGELCREKRIPVNVASDRTLCDFYFPGIVRAGNVTVGVIAGGKDHKKAARIREKIERLLHEEESDSREQGE